MKTAINTRTQEEYDALMRYYESKGIEWAHFGRATSCPEWWDEDKSETCVSTDYEPGFKFLVYSHISYFEQRGFTIIPYTEFAKANIVEELDWKTKYEEAVKLLSDCLSINSVYEKDNYLLEEIKAFLTKHNVTPNRDAKKSN